MYSRKTNQKTIWSAIKELIMIGFILLIIRICIFESFYVPTGSMVPNIMVGDFVIGTKYNYGYSRYSLPFFPDLFKGRVLNFYPPLRGDIIVFYVPEQKDERLIKRIIGLPGDTIQMIDNVLYINDKPIESKYIGEDIEEENTMGDSYNQLNKITYKKYVETLPNGKQYVARYSNDNVILYKDTAKFVVPEDEYFVMGDNRNRSLDSRSGYTVKLEQIIAKASAILFSNKHNFYYNSFGFKDIPTFFQSFRGDRFFKSTSYNLDLEKLNQNTLEKKLNEDTVKN